MNVLPVHYSSSPGNKNMLRITHIGICKSHFKYFPYVLFSRPTQDDDNFFDEPSSTVRYDNCHSAHVGICSQPQMPPYPIGGYMALGSGYGGPASAVPNANVKGNGPTTQLPSALTTRVLRRTSKFWWFGYNSWHIYIHLCVCVI